MRPKKFARRLDAVAWTNEADVHYGKCRSPGGCYFDCFFSRVGDAHYIKSSRDERPFDFGSNKIVVLHDQDARQFRCVLIGTGSFIARKHWAWAEARF